MPADDPQADVGSTTPAAAHQSASDPPRDDSRTTVEELKQVMRDFVEERNWKKFHNAKNLSMSMAIEAGELMEHFQWLTSEQVVAGNGYTLADVEEELADVVCYALSISNALDIDLSQAIERKMIKNRRKYPISSAEDFPS